MFSENIERAIHALQDTTAAGDTTSGGGGQPPNSPPPRYDQVKI